MLKITAIGNLTHDVELKMNENTGKPYAILRIGVICPMALRDIREGVELAEVVRNVVLIRFAAQQSADIPAHAWYSGYVKYLSNNGITYGKSKTIFAPNDAITRAEFTTPLRGPAVG